MFNRFSVLFVLNRILRTINHCPSNYYTSLLFPKVCQWHQVEEKLANILLFLPCIDFDLQQLQSDSFCL